MTFDDLRRLLEPERDALRAQGVTALYVFGSVARGEATSNSDVDVMIDVDPQSHFNLIDLSGVHIKLAERLGGNVDVVMRDSIHRRIKDRVLKEALRVF
jgi:predicted nucleotidyltransferase